MALTCRELELDPKQFPPKQMAAQVVEPEERADRPRDLRRPGPDRAGQGAGRGLRRVPAPAVRRGRDGLRRPDHGHGQPLPGPARGGGGVPPPVPARARGRVPGHQPRAVHPGPGARLGHRRPRTGEAGSAPSCAWSATPTSPSTPSAAPPSATSWSSSRTTRTRRSSCWSRTTARTQNILAAANAVVSQNPGRMPKNLWSDSGAGPPIVGYVADNEHDEAAFVAEEVDRLADAGQATPGQVAVFYRTNAQSRVFEEVFIRVGLPYRVVGGVRFYERREVRDLLAYLRLHRQPGRRGLAAPGAEHPEAGHRRPGRGVRGGLRPAGADHLRPGAGRPG